MQIDNYSINIPNRYCRIFLVQPNLVKYLIQICLLTVQRTHKGHLTNDARATHKSLTYLHARGSIKTLPELYTDHVDSFGDHKALAGLGRSKLRLHKAFWLKLVLVFPIMRACVKTMH